MLAGRWPVWLLLLSAASSAGVFAVPAASAQTRPVSPTARPTTVAPSVARPAVEPAARMARGCSPLPELAGQEVDRVLPKLSRELFRPRVNPESSSQPRGTILRQPATQLIEGRLCWVDIAVSDGSLTRVPRLKGATADEAARRLAAADLRIATREKSSDEPAGRVFDQKPDAGDEVPRQSTVVAVIATPSERISPAAAAAAAAAAAIGRAVRDVPPRPPEPEPAEETCLPLPDLAGQNVEEVLPTLGRRYFRPRLSREPSSEPPGTILRQPTTAPIDGSLCYVDVAISDGSLTRVPELRGATRDEAERMLAAADLRITTREKSSEEPAGRVFDQKPRPGDEVRRQSTVTAIVALPELFDVPPVIGLPYDEAARRLNRFIISRDVGASRLPSGQVIDQDPRPPAQRPAGAAVRLDVSDGSLVLVPPVERRALAAARAELGQADLRPEAREQEGELAPGLITTQEPTAGTEVSRGSRVRLVVSTGLPVPDVVGRPVSEVAVLLDRFDLRQSTVRSREPEGQVIGQEPRPPARVAAGTVVRVDVSDGSLVVVPPVEGEGLESARAALEEVDLLAAVEELEGELAPGLVATQEPAAGTEVSRGSTVRLVISSGLPVPDVVGRQIAEAATLLDRFRVEQAIVRSREPEGQVIDQEPRPPVRVAAGTVVRVDLSDGSLVLVPPVERGALDSARAALDEADLLAEVEEREGELAPGVVASQDPAAGTEVSRGSVVRLVVSTGRPVPAVRDDGNGSAWPRWLTYLGVLLAGSGLFYAVRLRLRPPPTRPDVSARIESDLGSAELTDVALAGPEIHLTARIEAGDSQVRLEGDSL